MASDYEQWAADPKRRAMSFEERIVEWIRHNVEERKRNNANPNKTVHYTPFGQAVRVHPTTRRGLSQRWGCTFWRRILRRPCEFDLGSDPACDCCLHPEERK